MSESFQPDPENLAYLEALDAVDSANFECLFEKKALKPIQREGGDAFRIAHLIWAYRTYGHLLAKTHLIGHEKKPFPSQLSLEALGFKERDLERPFPTNGLLPEKFAPLKAMVAVLKQIYSGTIGVEYMGFQDESFEKWLQSKIEPKGFHFSFSIEQKKLILEHLNRSELFESFMHTKYVGQKRFSLEGSETLIPILAGLIEKGADLNAEEFVLGMAHRGRLNVLANILNKSYSLIFEEFEEGYISSSFEGSGDVKYHKGFSSLVETEHGHKVQVNLAPNPSHLEAVNAVVEGEARAKQDRKGDSKGEFVIPILIHGDAAIAGQGVVYETLQLYKLKGYATGGTIHIIINNQIGFTTSPKEGRSTFYCSDIAKTFGAPVFHVNGEDPEGCLHTAFLAMEMRQRFHCDVFIELNCYRKYGHNEADEPAFTQPKIYEEIKRKIGVRELYRDALIQQGVLEKKMAEELEKTFKDSLQKALADKHLPTTGILEETVPEETSKKQIKKVETAVSKALLDRIGLKLSIVPDHFTPHSKLKRLIEERKKMVPEGTKSIDWGMGELLTYGTLLDQGVDIRLSGQDCARGTFSHRHCLWVDQKEESVYSPLQDLSGKFEVYNSPLSEYAALGFEYGYSLGKPDSLVIWEAQFGDFSNGAQIIHDQFISTGEQKWGQKSGIVLLLPHGYEGQGPEHSSARIERFLSLAGENNLIIANPTTPAQFFHLLRRQMLKPMKKPLIVFTPKGLLRAPHCTSEKNDFTKGTFLEIISDSKSDKNVEHLIFCSGRIYYDLLEEREKQKNLSMAIVRIEQLYPLELKQLQEILKTYPQLKKVFYAQEEPENMGAWGFLEPNLRNILSENITLEYVGRERSASPAAGSFARHKKEYETMMHRLFGRAKGAS